MPLSDAFIKSIEFALITGTILFLACLLIWLIGLFFGRKDKVSEKIQRARFILFFLPAFYFGVFSIIFPAIASKSGINPILSFVISFCLCVALIICCSKIHERFYPGDYKKIES